MTRSKVATVTTPPKGTKTSYRIGMWDIGNVLSISLQVQLLEASESERFKLPFRQTSGKYIQNLTLFGQELVKGLAEVGGVTEITIRLYDVELILGGLYTAENVTNEVEKLLLKVYQSEDFEATGNVCISRDRLGSSEKTSGKKEHPYGSLPLRIHARQMRNKKFLG